ncbi:MAG: STAS domain-containing protein [Gammaproteobacteria bacterium]|nr:STAS domain-containing protein [Gammaproteobacteria bacterium]
MARRKKTEPASAAGTPLVLAGVLDIAAAQHLRQHLGNALDAGDPLRFDARAVERIDASALQLLYACVQAATSKGMSCTWDGVSEALCTAADLCGMRDSLGLTGHAP